MRWLAGLLGSMVMVGTTLAVAPVVQATPFLPPTIAPDASLSTTGDYASDVLGNPWDFSDEDDVLPYPGVGCVGATPTDCGIGLENGILRVNAGGGGGVVRLVRNWGDALAWGHDGPNHPVDAGRYSVLTLSNCASSSMAVTFTNDAGESGVVPFEMGTCARSTSLDLRQSPQWRGRIVELNLHISPGSFLTLDWARLRRPDAPPAPPGGAPVARVLSPNADGGVDYASSYGNPWDMTDPGDVASTQGMRAGTGGNGLAGTTFGGDAGVVFPLPIPFDPDRFHRFSADLCLTGGFSLSGDPGGGMNARIVYSPDLSRYTETQDIVVYPGCHHIAIDLATNPPAEVNDEASVNRIGWRGQKFSYLRFDPDEDPGTRGFSVANVKFADDAAFSDSFGIQYQDVTGNGGTADIYATPNRGSFDGTLIARGAGVAGGNVNTFTWNGTDASGNAMGNGTYWIYTVITNRSGKATGYSDAPVRLERPQPATPSTFVPLSPARLLDTRSGIGGNIVPLGPDVTTSLQVAGREGVPAVGATSVVLNVTVDHPSEPGVMTVWPSGEPRQLVSSMNWNPGDVLANLVTVKLGADGKVNLYNLKGLVPTVVDVVGYYTANANAGRYTPLAPGRVLDTGFANQIGPGQTIDVQVTGVRGVPASGVSGVALNVTVDNPSAPSYFTVFPAGEGRPNASTLNFVPGLTVANLTLAKVGAGGKVSIWNYDGTARVVADVVGYFSASGGRFVPVSPTRIVDTRVGLGLPQAQIGGGQTVTIPMIGGASPIPGNATGAVVNLTSAESSAQSYLTAYPTGEQRPAEGSSVNPRVGVPVPNQDYAKLGAGGQIDLFNYTGNTDVVIDVFGYIVP